MLGETDRARAQRQNDKDGSVVKYGGGSEHGKNGVEDAEDEELEDTDSNTKQLPGRWSPLGQVKELGFPSWQISWNAAGPRDFMVTYAAYRTFTQDIEGGGNVKRRTTSSPPKELVLAGKKAMEIAAAKQEREAQREVERMKKEEEREKRKVFLLTEKLRRFAEKQQEKLKRQKEREESQNQRLAAKLENEEQKRQRQIRVEARKKERQQEIEQRKRDREREMERNRAAKRARGSTRDEDLDSYAIPVPRGRTWELADDVPALAMGDLLMIWNFLGTFGKYIASPQPSLYALRGMLSVPARVTELTDIHIALMRCLLMDMDRTPDPITGLTAEPRRANLLTSLTWPYMACMYLEENADRLGPKEEAVAGMLWESEYHTLSARWKLELLCVLCNECLSCEPVRSAIDDTRSYITGRDMMGVKKKAFDAFLKGDLYDDDEDGDDPKSSNQRKKRYVRLLGTDRQHNRYYVLADQQGDPLLVAVHKSEFAEYQKLFMTSDKALVQDDFTDGMSEEEYKRGELYVSHSETPGDDGNLARLLHAPVLAEAFVHPEMPARRETTYEDWYTFWNPKEMQPLFDTLDARGYREAPLRARLTEVRYAMVQAETLRTRKAYEASEASSVQEVLDAILAAVEESAAAEQASLATVGLHLETTMAAMEAQGAEGQDFNSADRLVSSSDAAIALADDEDAAEMESHILTDDLDGRAVWAHYSEGKWWPCSVVALCADDVPQNVLKKRKSEEKKRRQYVRGDEQLPPLVLVQFLETGEYGWVERFDLASFWQHYEEFSRLERAKKFVKAVRLGRLARYGENAMSYDSATSTMRRKTDRLCDLLGLVR